MRARLRDFMRFAALSGGGWIVDTVLLLALTGGAGLVVQSANLLSASTAAAIVYLVAHRWVHAGVQDRVELRLGLYLVYTAIVILAASAAMIPLTGLAARALGEGAAAVFVAKCLVTPPQLLCNFFVSRALARTSGVRRNG